MAERPADSVDPVREMAKQKLEMGGSRAKAGCADTQSHGVAANCTRSDKGFEKSKKDNTDHRLHDSFEGKPINSEQINSLTLHCGSVPMCSMCLCPFACTRVSANSGMCSR